MVRAWVNAGDISFVPQSCCQIDPIIVIRLGLKRGEKCSLVEIAITDILHSDCSIGFKIYYPTEFVGGGGSVE